MRSDTVIEVGGKISDIEKLINIGKALAASERSLVQLNHIYIESDVQFLEVVRESIVNQTTFLISIEDSHYTLDDVRTLLRDACLDYYSIIHPEEEGLKTIAYGWKPGHNNEVELSVINDTFSIEYHDLIDIIKRNDIQWVIEQHNLSNVRNASSDYSLIDEIDRYIESNISPHP